MTYRRSDVWVGAGLLAFCLFAGWRTLRIPSVATGTSAGPDFVPWLMIGAIVVLSLIMMARNRLQNRTAPEPAPVSDVSPDDEAEDKVAGARAARSALLRIGLFVLMLIAYAALFMTLGYLVTTIVVFVSGMFLLGERRPLVLVLVPALTTAAIYFGFTELLNVWLP